MGLSLSVKDTNDAVLTGDSDQVGVGGPGRADLTVTELIRSELEDLFKWKRITS